MESWLPAIFGFGGVLIGSLFSLWLTKLQLNNADKRFERELLKAREDAQRQRRWEVRGEPLLKLRKQLGQNVTKNEKVVRYATLERIRLLAEKDGQTQQGARDELKNAIRDVYAYMDSGELDQALSMVDDKAIRDGVRQLRKMITQAWLGVLPLGTPIMPISVEELNKSLTLAEQIDAKTTKVQELINKRLEEL